MTNTATETFAFRWDKPAVLEFIDLIKRLRTQGHLSYVALIKSCLLPKHYSEEELQSWQQRFSRWVNRAHEGNNWRGIREAQFKKLAAHVFRICQESDVEDKQLLPDAMFFGLMAWLNVDQEAVLDLRSSFPGEYVAYRHSLSAPGFVAVGTLRIYADPVTGAVRTHERFIIPDRDGEPGKSFEMKGYLVRKHGRYYIFSLHDDDRDIYVQYSYVETVARRGTGVEGSQVLTISGVISDIQGADFYSCRFVCVRGNSKRPGLLRLHELQPNVKRDLESSPQIVTGPDNKIGYVVTF
jgi:hypothetical protein